MNRFSRLVLVGFVLVAASAVVGCGGTPSTGDKMGDKMGDKKN